ncbi:MAG: 2-hydroxychromene-2-carboxylate isomerase [Paracoccaceae bacterium]
MLSADLFYSFRSPYSYLGAARYRQLTRDWDLQVRLRPVYPIAIRNPAFFEQVNPLWVPYLLKDVVRTAEFNGIPFQWPKPDPVVMDRETREISSNQPYIRRLTYLGLEAARRGKGLDYACAVGHALWGEGVVDWHLPENFAPIVARAGLDLSELEAANAGQEDALEAQLAANQAEQERAGHWGTPCLVFDGEPFFGQDRIDMAIWRMQQQGLQAA